MNEKVKRAIDSFKTLWRKAALFAAQTAARIEPEHRRLVQWGGLKLKLIGAVVLIVIFAVGTLNYFLSGLMERSISAKAYEVGQMAIERVADASFNAIVERTYENRVNLMEMIKETKEASIEGFLDISIYAFERKEGQGSFVYFGGFQDRGEPLSDARLIEKLLKSQNKSDARLIEKLLKSQNKAVLRQSVDYGSAEEPIEAIRFVRPIIFNFGDQKHVVGAVVLHYDREAIVGPIRQAGRVASAIAVGVLLISVAFGWWFSLRLSRPILDVSDAAKRVAEGDLEVQLNIRTADEIEALSNEFNRMVKGLRERERMQKFVSGSAMDLIKNDSARMELGGSYRTQTFLFTDIRGFTAMSENRKPEEVVSIINHYLDLQTAIIRKHGGDIDKFVGDEIMATFEGEADLARAVRAAKELQAAIGAENARRKAAGEVIVNVGAGINRGEVIVGNMGSKDRMDFTSIGAAVNLAARLCSKAEPGEVLLPEAIYQTIGEDFGGVAVEPVTAKGFSQPIQTISVRG
ncbi:MAG: adenylate/guanylate cyclase domain-containing protein [Campylobacterales bacterium]